MADGCASSSSTGPRPSVDGLPFWPARLKRCIARNARRALDIGVTAMMMEWCAPSLLVSGR